MFLKDELHRICDAVIQSGNDLQIGFIGHRNRETHKADLLYIATTYPEAIWVHSGTVGFASQIERVAIEKRIAQLVIPPDYNTYGYTAPLKCNRRIIEVSDVLIACYDGRSKGNTRKVMTIARRKGVPVILVESIRIDNYV